MTHKNEFFHSHGRRHPTAILNYILELSEEGWGEVREIGQTELEDFHVQAVLNGTRQESSSDGGGQGRSRTGARSRQQHRSAAAAAGLSSSAAYGLRIVAHL